MESITLVSLLAGVAGTTAMLAFLYTLAYTHAVESKLPDALGAITLRRMEGAHHAGLILHYAFGIAFGFIYTNLIVLADPESKIAVAFLGLVLGLVHGIFATFAMIGMAERHPMKKFRESPVASSLVHGIAHLIYGLAVGITLILLGGGHSAN